MISDHKENENDKKDDYDVDKDKENRDKDDDKPEDEDEEDDQIMSKNRSQNVANKNKNQNKNTSNLKNHHNKCDYINTHKMWASTLAVDYGHNVVLKFGVDHSLKVYGVERSKFSLKHKYDDVGLVNCAKFIDDKLV